MGDVVYNCTKHAIDLVMENLDHDTALEEACVYAVKACPPSSTFNFFDLYYCHFNQSIAAMVPICVVIIVLCFYLLGTTADGYLAPALECISYELHCSEQLAISYALLNLPFLPLQLRFPYLLRRYLLSFCQRRARRHRCARGCRLQRGVRRRFSGRGHHGRRPVRRRRRIWHRQHSGNQPNHRRTQSLPQRPLLLHHSAVHSRGL